ncbi:LysR substrate-binding domain-containing protein [Muribaculum sp.]|uniref:LysR substrate-binding domain-containing protein n=1 Tax=Muribaculum sp. TaxID=1918611 RepID=UPI0023CEED58|nr:LysR substrate-binding domain-containing protein [Muribaculum sp.]MDE5706337.1 LysR family transcriptional regulator [Muribaculum sp.]MDE5922209.1 LysR family transcriptional regulator [Muribaculum sp.]
MELRQLRYFVKTAETLSFSDAARALNLAQSTLSQQIKQLEDELKVQLFERSSHSMNLTECGSELLPLAIRTLHDAETCRDRINDLQKILTGTLNIGVTYSFSPILTETLMSFMKQYPHVRMNIYYKPMAELMDMLTNRTVDFVLAFRPTVRNEEIESHVLFDNHLAVIVKDSHTLASREKISLSELEKFDLALPTKGLQARNALEHYIARSMVRLKNIRIELNEVNILLELIKKSNLITILAEATIYNATGVKAIPIEMPSNEMDGCVHMLKNAYRKRSSLAFIKLLKDSIAVRERVLDF